MAFAGGLFTPRTLAGNVNYSVGAAAIPEAGHGFDAGVGFGGVGLVSAQAGLAGAVGGEAVAMGSPGGVSRFHQAPTEGTLGGFE